MEIPLFNTLFRGELLGSTENARPENEGPMRDQIDQRLIDTTGK